MACLPLSPGTDTPSIGRNLPTTPFNDNLVPPQKIQNTYTRLTTTYSPSLIQNWPEGKTEPSKYIYEDIAIAAFLIELWKGMYDDQSFPGFVDIACGNGVVVCILLMEGYTGYGIDARRREAWNCFPGFVRGYLVERVCVPKPFRDVLIWKDGGGGGEDRLGVTCIDGIFEPGTFIISKHADELTVWTPLLAALSGMGMSGEPLPFFVVPCCSCGLSGGSFRYPPPLVSNSVEMLPSLGGEQGQQPSQQPSSGDLKALRASRIQAHTNYDSLSHMTSTYGCLAAKVVAVSEELGIEVEKTKLEIPSTRNIGIVGGRVRSKGLKAEGGGAEGVLERVRRVVERECRRDGGVEAAAEVWVKRAMSLRTGDVSHDGEDGDIHIL
ncbi:tRNA(Ser) Um(44) 2'-O-methyltransferase [Arachnomyces sp. PD_36]|nr:tRNA(Ser) Um(44) 2'-O-methyltransferase [Arachnomyces sp. PD_36]